MKQQARRLVGVMLVLAMLPAAAAAQKAGIELLFRVGTSNGIGKLMSVAPVADGGFWASEEMSGRIHLFDAKGALVRSIGKRGSGAGELSGERAQVTAVGDNLYVLDVGNRRAVVLSGDGTALKTSELTVMGGLPMGWAPLGTRIVQLLAPLPEQARMLMGGSDKYQVMSLDPLSDAPPATVLELAIPEQTTISMDGMQLTISMDMRTPRPVLASDGRERLLVATTDTYRIRIMDAKGAVIGNVARQVERRRLSDAELKRIRSFTDSTFNEGFAKGMAASGTTVPMPQINLTLPEYAPEISQLFGSRDFILVGRASEHLEDGSRADDWDVLGYDGTFRGTIQLPAGVQLAGVMGNRIFGVEKSGVVGVWQLKY